MPRASWKYACGCLFHEHFLAIYDVDAASSTFAIDFATLQVVDGVVVVAVQCQSVNPRDVSVAFIEAKLRCACSGVEVVGLVGWDIGSAAVST